MQEYGHITPQQRLIIRISRNSLVFASINNESGGAISFYPYVLKSGISMAANLREAFRTEDILRESYSRILIMIDSPTLMVPLEEFREDAQQVLYQHAYQDHEKDEIVNTVLPDFLYCSCCSSMALSASAQFHRDKRKTVCLFPRPPHGGIQLRSEPLQVLQQF